MAAKTRKQIGLSMRSDLYKGLTRLARENGQTTTHVLEQAAEHYLRFVAPTQNTVRPEAMSQVRRSIDKNKELLKLLAK